MAFKLDSVVPWGRNLEEYKLMFGLDDRDMTKKIAGFGDGPACFNCEMTNAGGNVVSFDPIYQFSKEEIEKRIEKVRITVMQQMRENMDNYVWTHIKDLDELEHIRMSAMKNFYLTTSRVRKREDMYFMSCQPDCHMNQKVLILA